MPRSLAVNLHLPAQVRIEPGALEGLAEVIDGLGLRRVLLVHGPNVAKAGLAERCADLLDSRLAGVFADSRSPTDDETAAAVRARTDELEVDGVVAIGGGSAVDAGKIAVDQRRGIPLVAISTTLSGAELTLDCGVVDPVRKVKQVLRGPHLVATAALYDPLLLRSLDRAVLAGSAMNALAHCVEALYTPTTNEFVQAIAIGGARLLHRGLVMGFEHGELDEALVELVEGAFSAGVACGNASIALHHTMCHYVGPQLGISHGAANAAMLPHVMRFNARVASEQLGRLGLALGVGDSADAAIDAIAEVRRHLGLPVDLDAVGYTTEIGERIADHVLLSARLANNPRPVARDDVLSILEAAR